MFVTRRKTIQLTPDEDHFLRVHHRDSGVPDGQFVLRPDWFHDFVETWNSVTGRSDTTDDIHSYITTRRKWNRDRSGRWEPLGELAEKLDSEPDPLTGDQWQVLLRLYFEIDGGSDNLLFDKELRSELGRQFRMETRTDVSDLKLTAALISRRKSGNLPKKGRGPDGGSFADFDQVAQ